jgi:hypothetical protein
MVVAFRDVFEVDGQPVRDRAERLSQLLATFSADSLDQAIAIATPFDNGAVQSPAAQSGRMVSAGSMRVARSAGR